MQAILFLSFTNSDYKPYYIDMLDLVYFCIAAIYIVLLILVFREGIKSSVNFYFALFMIGLLSWHVSLYFYLFVFLGDSLLTVGRLNYATGPILLLGLLGFFYSFPNKSLVIKKPIRAAFWFWSVFLAIITMFTDLVDKNEVYVQGIGPVVELGEAYYIYTLHFFVVVIMTLLIGFKKRTTLKGLSKVKYEYCFWVFVPIITLFTISNLILPIFGYIAQFQYSPILLLPIAVSCFLAMWKYRFFNLSHTSLKILRYSFLFMASIVLGNSVYFFSSYFLPGFNPLLIRIVSFLAALMIFVNLDRIFPRLISKSFQEFRTTLQELESALYYCSSYKDLAKILEETFVIKLHISSANIFLVRDSAFKIDIPIYIKNDLTKEIALEKSGIFVAEELLLSPISEQRAIGEEMRASKMSLCFPLFLGEKLIGLFSLGAKTQKNLYSKEEIQELVIARRSLEICFTNILLHTHLKEENDLMKKIIKEKTQSLRKQNKKITGMLRQQSDFIAVTAHEFRTPLNIALLQLEDTLESYEHSEKVLEDMNTMAASLEKLKHLTQNMFDVQQYDLEKVNLHKGLITVGGFIEGIFAEFKDLMVVKNIDFSLKKKVKKSTKIDVDECRLRQVLQNLLSNAYKFTSENGAVCLLVEEDVKMIKICVVDNGKGVSDDNKQRIFKKFQTVNVGMGMGIGMGLYICEKIIALHKGKLWVEDTPGAGATFCFSIPKLLK